MASLYKKPVVKTDRKTGKKIKGKSAKWWGRYRDALGIEKRVPLAKDKSAAQSMLNELVRKVELEKAGRLDPFEEHAKRPLREHVRDFETYLQHKGNSKQHVHDTVTRIRTTIEGCHAVKIVDVTASCVQAYLADRRSAGLAIETSNHYLRAIKSFCRWLVRDKRASDNPLAHLPVINSTTDRRHDRRALTPEEFERLVRAAEQGPPIESIAGPDRVILYVLSAWTGYRKGELGSLTLNSLRLDNSPPAVVVSAAYSKRRREDMQVLHPQLVVMLREWLKLKHPIDANELLFPVSGKVPGGIERKTSKMMRLDLKAARTAWIEECESDAERQTRQASDFLAYRDHSGRYADFHSNRHTFITSLSRSRVSPKVAQTLARHSDIRLTMGVYTHLELHDQQEGIESLPAPPSASTTLSRPEQKTELGTEADRPSASEMVPTLVPCGAENGAKRLAAKPPQSASDCSDSSVEAAKQQKEPADTSSRRAIELGGSSRQSASTFSEVNAAKNRVRAQGLEPWTYGLKVRCSTN